MVPMPTGKVKHPGIHTAPLSKFHISVVKVETSSLVMCRDGSLRSRKGRQVQDRDREDNPLGPQWKVRSTQATKTPHHQTL